jgi:hypothetical protein
MTNAAFAGPTATIGLAVPGVVGASFLLAGAAVLAPGGSKLLARWTPVRRCGGSVGFLTICFPHR